MSEQAKLSIARVAWDHDRAFAVVPDQRIPLASDEVRE